MSRVVDHCSTTVRFRLYLRLGLSECRSSSELDLQRAPHASALSPVLATRRLINHTSLEVRRGAGVLAPSVRRLPSASVRRCAEGRLWRNHVGERV